MYCEFVTEAKCYSFFLSLSFSWVLLTSVSLEIWLLKQWKSFFLYVICFRRYDYKSVDMYSFEGLMILVMKIYVLFDLRLYWHVEEFHCIIINSVLYNERINSMYIFDSRSSSSSCCSFVLVLAYTYERERSSRKDLITYQGEYRSTNFFLFYLQAFISRQKQVWSKKKNARRWIFKLIFSFIYLFIDWFNQFKSNSIVQSTRQICMCQ